MPPKRGRTLFCPAAAAALPSLARQASSGRYVALLLVAYGVLVALALEKATAALARGSGRKAA